MIRIYGVALDDLKGLEHALLESLPPRISLPWQARHPSNAQGKTALASLAGVWLLCKSDVAGTLAYTENGKPYLTHPDRAISITHTHSHAFCAISDSNEPIGLDAEELGRLSLERLPALAARWFTASEQEALGSTPTEEAFLSVWTRKEALVKQTGDGLRSIRKTDGIQTETRSYRIGNTILCLAHPLTEESPPAIEML